LTMRNNGSFTVAWTLLISATCLVATNVDAQPHTCDQSALTNHLVTAVHSQEIFVKQRDAMAVLFRKEDIFIPLYCNHGKQILYGERCAQFMPTKSLVRLMTGKTITIGKTKSDPGGFFWSDTERVEIGFKSIDADSDGAIREKFELAVWPADANPGLEYVQTGDCLDSETVTALEALGMPPPPYNRKKESRSSEAQVRVIQHSFMKGMEFASISGARHGLFVKNGKDWRLIGFKNADIADEFESATESFLWARSDVNGDTKSEIIIFNVLRFGGFGIEVLNENLEKRLHSYVIHLCG
jgi:hypothetical protein